MRQVAIFNEKINDHSKGQIYIDPLKIQTFRLNNHVVTTGLLKTRSTAFNGSNPENHDKVLVRKKAFSCNYRDKALTLQAQHRVDGFAAKNEAKFYTLGSEFVAEVISVGDKVDSLKVGDRVIGNGNYPFSEYENARPGLPTNHGSKELEIFHFSKLVRIPASMPDEIAASFPIGGQTAYSMVRRLQLNPGEKVLVTAASSNTSLFAINAMKHMPVDVYAVTTRSDFIAELKEMGVKEVFVVERGLQNLAQDEKVLDFVQKNGLFNAVIDPFFDVYLGQVMPVIAAEGRYTTCGMYAQPGVGVETVIKKLPKNLDRIIGIAMIKNIQIIGNCIGKTFDLENAIQDYDEGKLAVAVDSIYQGEQVSEFFERSFNSTDRFGKVVYKY